MDLKNNLICS